MENLDKPGEIHQNRQESHTNQFEQKAEDSLATYTKLTAEQLKAKIEDAIYFVDPSVPEPERVDAPEGWEEKRRAHWMKELPDGAYFFDSPGIKLQAGKGFAVDYYIALEKVLLNYK